jgi:hypothetical protein
MIKFFIISSPNKCISTFWGLYFMPEMSIRNLRKPNSLTKGRDVLAVVLAERANNRKDSSPSAQTMRTKQMALREKEQTEFRRANKPYKGTKGLEVLSTVLGHLAAKRKDYSKTAMPMIKRQVDFRKKAQDEIIQSNILIRPPRSIVEIQTDTKPRKGFQKRLQDLAKGFKFPIHLSSEKTVDELARNSHPGLFPDFSRRNLSQTTLDKLQSAAISIEGVGVALNQGHNIHGALDKPYEATSSIVTPEDKRLLQEKGLMTQHPTGAFLPSDAASSPGSKEAATYQDLILSSFRKRTKNQPLTPLETAMFHQVTAMHAGRNLNDLARRIWRKPWQTKFQAYRPENRQLYPLRDTNGKSRFIDIESIPSQSSPTDYAEVVTGKGKPVTSFPTFVRYKGKLQVEEPEVVYRNGEIVERASVHNSSDKKVAHIKQHTFSSAGLKRFFDEDISGDEREKMWKDMVEVRPSNSTKPGEQGKIGLELYAARDLKEGEGIPYDGEVIPLMVAPGREAISEEHLMNAGKLHRIDGSGDSGRANSDFLVAPNGKVVAEMQVSPEFNMANAAFPSKFKDGVPVDVVGLFATRDIRKGERLRFPYRWDAKYVDQFLNR